MLYLLVLIRLHSAISNQKILYQALNDCYLSHITRKLGKGGSVVIQWLSHVIRDDRDIIYHPAALSQCVTFYLPAISWLSNLRSSRSRKEKEGSQWPKAFSCFVFLFGKGRIPKDFGTSHLLELMHHLLQERTRY